jgi:hypothetical protein
MRPYSVSVLLYWNDSSSSLSWSPDNINEGRCGVTSMKVAALCHDFAKFSMLFTPPTWARALRRRAIEDLEEISVLLIDGV